VTSVGTIVAFIDFWVTFFAVTIETIVTDTGISADLGAIGSLFRDTGGVRVAAMVTGSTIVWFVTGVGTEGFKVRDELLIPAVIALELNLGDNIFEGMGPHAGGRVTIVVNMAATNVTGHWVAFDGPVSFGSITKSVKFGCDCLPSGNGFLDAIGCLHGDLFEFFIGESRVFVKVAHAIIEIIRMCAFRSVTFDIFVTVVTCASVTLEGIGTVCIVSAVVVASDAFVDLGNAFTICIFIVTLFTFAGTIGTDSVGGAFDTVALVDWNAIE
jgi:hypothetical protein